jgi:hypothetical protein
MRGKGKAVALGDWCDSAEIRKSGKRPVDKSCGTFETGFMNLGTDSFYELYGIPSPHALEEIASELPGVPELELADYSRVIALLHDDRETPSEPPLPATIRR